MRRILFLRCRIQPSTILMNNHRSLIRHPKPPPLRLPLLRRRDRPPNPTMRTRTRTLTPHSQRRTRGRLSEITRRTRHSERRVCGRRSSVRGRGVSVRTRPRIVSSKSWIAHGLGVRRGCGCARGGVWCWWVIPLGLQCSGSSTGTCACKTACEE